MVKGNSVNLFCGESLEPGEFACLGIRGTWFETVLHLTSCSPGGKRFIAFESLSPQLCDKESLLCGCSVHSHLETGQLICQW